MAKTKATTQKKDSAQEPQVISDNTTFKLTFKWENLQPVYTKLLNDFAKRLKKPGFRQGKVPTHIAEQNVNLNELYDQILQQVVPDKYIAYVKEHKLEPLTQPQIRPLKLDKGQDWELEVQIAQKPEFKIGKYQTLVKKALKEADKEIKKQTEELKKKAKDEAKKADKAKDAKAAPAKTELTDKEVTDIKLGQVFQALVKEIQPQIPELLLKTRVRNEVEQLEKQLSQMQLNLEDYLKHQGQTFDQFTQQIAMMQLGQIQLEFILESIILEEKLEATDQEIKDKISQLKKELPPEQAAHVEHDHYRQHIIPVINREKVTDFLLQLDK